MDFLPADACAKLSFLWAEAGSALYKYCVVLCLNVQN